MRYRQILVGLMVAVAAQAEAAMHHAAGTFEVTMTAAAGDPVWLNRMTMTKVYAGALVATATGEFLSAGDPAAGSAGYIAAERIDGTLDGRAGTFVVMQSATMDKGAPVMRVFVVPGSATGALAGMTGTMTIRIESRQHFYDLDYHLAP
jgi:FlaG/FlaF family flagellin (archaellin)